MTKQKSKHRLLIIGIFIGVAYGIVSHMVFGQKEILASVTYILITPGILGTVPLMFAENEKLKSYRNRIVIPWMTVATFFLALYLMGIEDSLSLLIMAAPFFVMGTIGALIYGTVQKNRRKRKYELLSLMFLPFLSAAIEKSIASPSEIYNVKSAIAISAEPETIWGHIVEVNPIKKEEYKVGIFNILGIPRPINASIDKKGLGGLRIGNFEGGLRFMETIVEYSEDERVAFNITIDSKTINAQHVLNDGYFMFVGANYELAPLKNGQVKLTLFSSYRLTTNINGYAKFWGNRILFDFQERLLRVIKKRCEN